MKKINIKNKKLFAIIGIVIILIITILIVVVSNNKKELKEQEDSNFTIEELNKKIFNSSYELYTDMDSALLLSGLFTKVINNNKEEDHIITIVYNNKEIIKEEDILKIKDKIKNSDDINISLEYDADGYVNKVIFN